jgi:transcriptional regulator with XRE-family HTH domain
MIDTKEYDKKLGQKIKRLRLERGLSRNDVAPQMDVTHQQMQKYENGTNRITCSRLAQLSFIFNVSISDILEGLNMETDMGRPRAQLETFKVISRISDPKKLQVIRDMCKLLV